MNSMCMVLVNENEPKATSGVWPFSVEQKTTVNLPLCFPVASTHIFISQIGYTLFGGCFFFCFSLVMKLSSISPHTWEIERLTSQL